MSDPNAPAPQPPERQSTRPAAQPSAPTQPYAQPVAQPTVQPVAQPVAQPAAQPPVVQPAVVQPAVAAPAAQPLYPAGTPVAAVPVTPARPGLDAGRYWAGVGATALVAALVAVAGVLVLQEILGIDLVVQDVFGTDSPMTSLVVGAVVAALLAGALLHVLVLTTPRPRSFFGWIIGLVTLVAALLPLTWTDDATSAVATGIVHLVIGIAIWSLLSGVLTWTRRPVPRV
ncbi:DUF6069 family protein [Cellulomonas sp. H30R-01]|uniref:DUF6069 family protein n=1 Tax=Cellulomonas sp. H30R-01 TaxID=2704467 RepID=UPI00192EAC4C|nr:DUF6069 family protein [Cellulomonas sp. H30R-01]